MSCGAGFMARGTTSSYRKSLGAYECVDTQTDLENCTLMFYPPARHRSYPSFRAHPQVETTTSLFKETPRKVRTVLLFQALLICLATMVLAERTSACLVILSPPTRAHATVNTNSRLSRNLLRIRTRQLLISFNFFPSLPLKRR